MVVMQCARLSNRIVKKLTERKSFIIISLLEWSERNSPLYPWRRDTTPYNILISELLLRKTRADKVAEVYPLFLQQFPTIKHISDSSIDYLRKAIYTLGRLKRDEEIMNLAKKLAEKYSGNIPYSENDLFNIIGKQSRYTVNAIRCFAYGERVPIFDVNVNRILSRVFTVNLGPQPHKNANSWKLAQMLLPEKRIKEFNWALLDLGRMICTSKPKCGICPLMTVCDYAKNKVISGE